MTDEERRERRRARRGVNRDYINAQKRAWWAANRERINAEARTKAAANREKCRAKGRAYKDANRDRINGQARANYAADRVRRLAKNRAYRDKHRGRINLLQSIAYRNRRIAAGLPVLLKLSDDERRERKQAQDRKYYETHRENWPQYYLMHREKINSASRRRRERNREHIKLLARIRYHERYRRGVLASNRALSAAIQALRNRGIIPKGIFGGGNSRSIHAARTAARALARELGLL